MIVDKQEENRVKYFVLIETNTNKNILYTIKYTYKQMEIYLKNWRV